MCISNTENYKYIIDIEIYYFKKTNLPSMFELPVLVVFYIALLYKVSLISNKNIILKEKVSRLTNLDDLYSNTLKTMHCFS